MKKTLLFSAIMLATAATAAAKTYNGIIAYVEGGQTTYLLSDAPEVTYRNSSAILTVNGAQVAVVDLTGDKTLAIKYGNYDNATNILSTADKAKDDAPSVKKYLDRGLIIIVDENGKKYNGAGQRIK